MSQTTHSVEWYLSEAVNRNDLPRVKELITSHGFPAQRDALLVNAVKLHRTEIVKYLVDMRAKVESTESNVDSLSHFPIHLACEEGHLDILKFILQSRREYITCLRPNDDFSPLHSASENGQLEVVYYLLNEQADPNVKTNCNLTPLHLAAKEGHLKIVDVLCNYGADMEAQTAEHVTPLLSAVMHDHSDVVKLLLFRGACVNVKDKEGCSLLYFAVENRNASLISFILHFQPEIDEKVSGRMFDILIEGCNPAIDDLIVHSITMKHKAVSDFPFANAVKMGYWKTVKVLLELGVNPNDEMHNPLHVAVQNGHYEITQLLLKSGCDANSKDRADETPIYYLFQPVDKSQCFDILQLLVSSGADHNEAPELLHEAVNNRCFEVCKWLIENGANVNATDESHCTPLEYIATPSYCNEVVGIKGRIARLLLTNGANVSTELQRAAALGLLDVILVLLEFKADINAKDQYSHTPLYHAVTRRHENTVQILLENGAAVDAVRDLDAQRPLHLSIGRRNAKIVKLLLKYYADVNAQDGEGQTALHLASYRWDENEVFTVLLDNGSDVNILDHSGQTALSILYSGSHKKHESKHPMVRHILKLKVAGLFVNAQNEQLFRDMWLAPDNKSKQFERECNEEVARMKQFELCCHLKLIEVLVNPSNPAFVTKESVINNLESVDLNQFPIYRSMIQNKFKKNEEINAGKYWLKVLIKTQNVLLQETVSSLPMELLLDIVSYLDRKDLRELIACGEALKRQLD